MVGGGELMSRHSKAILFMPDGSEVELPAKWEICPACEGRAKSSAYLGAFTADRWNELDDDFHADYLAGHYDRPCERCDGLGRLVIADQSKMTKDQRREYIRQQREESESAESERMERLREEGWNE